MINMIDPRQNELFDMFKEFLSPLAYKKLISGWQGVFRHVILELLPAPEIANHFNPVFGRPTKELYSIAGLLLIKEFMDWTEEEAANAYMFNVDIQYALNLGRDKISMSVRTLQRYEGHFRVDELASQIMTDVTCKLISELDLDISKQRLDSTHIMSNMATFARTRLMGITIKRFLVQLKRHFRNLYDDLPEDLRTRYEVSQGALFGSVPSEKRSFLRQEVAEQMYFLITRFSGIPDIENRTTYKDLVTVFNQQCDVIEPKKSVENRLGDKEGEGLTPKDENGTIFSLEDTDKSTVADEEAKSVEVPSHLQSPDSGVNPTKSEDEVVRVVPKKKTGGRVIQNPSDPDATYDGRKGAGYHAQFSETCSEKNEVQLITYTCPETACDSDCNAVTPAIDKLESDQLLPDEILADTLYGSDENVINCKERGINLISPVPGKPPKEPPKDPSAKQKRLAARRQEEKTDEWKAAYAVRAGIEGTNSSIKRKTGLGQLRVRGRKSVFNVIFLKTAGWNILRASSSKKMKDKIAKIVKKLSQNRNSSTNLRPLYLFPCLQTANPMRFPTIIPSGPAMMKNDLAA